jgi:hypothetical protein
MSTKKSKFGKIRKKQKSIRTFVLFFHVLLILFYTWCCPFVIIIIDLTLIKDDCLFNGGSG